jgi:hypothetical protein
MYISEEGAKYVYDWFQAGFGRDGDHQLLLRLLTALDDGTWTSWRYHTMTTADASCSIQARDGLFVDVELYYDADPRRYHIVRIYESNVDPDDPLAWP